MLHNAIVLYQSTIHIRSYSVDQLQEPVAEFSTAWSGARELRVRLDGTLTTVADRGQRDLGRPDELADFIQRNVKAFPGDRYGRDAYRDVQPGL